jgi:hypothetical protein
MNAVSTVAFLLLLLGCTHADAAGASPQSSRKVVTLTAPRAATAGEGFRVRVVTGPLQRGQRIIARLPDGEIVGSVAPYGTRSAQHGGSYILSLPADAVHDGKLTLHLELSEHDRATRAPTDREVESVDLLVVPVSH